MLVLINLTKFSFSCMPRSLHFGRLGSCAWPASQKGQTQRSNRAQSDHAPTRDDDLLIRQGRTRIPHQMPNAIEAVQREGKGHERLQSNLEENRQSREAGR